MKAKGTTSNNIIVRTEYILWLLNYKMLINQEAHERKWNRQNTVSTLFKWLLQCTMLIRIAKPANKIELLATLVRHMSAKGIINNMFAKANQHETT